MRKVLQTIVRDTERYSISNSSELALSKPNLYIEKIALQGGETATTEDIVVTRSGINLLDKNKFPATQTIRGITFTNNGDGTITVDGTLTDSTVQNYVQYTLTNDYLTLTHKYLLIGCPSGGSYDTYQLYAYGGSYNDYGVGRIFAYSYEGIYPEIGIRIKNDVTVSNLIFKPQLYDLTAIYGEGNEPTTVEQFLKDYPEYEPYLPPKSLTFSRDYLLSLKGVNNLLDKSKFPATQTRNGITFTNNGDGTIIVDGTATNVTTLTIPFDNTNYAKSNHKYLIIGCPKNGSNSTYRLTASISKDGVWQNGFSDSGAGNISPSLVDGGKISIYINVINKTVCDNLVFKPELYDLTAIYGEGNEPTTVEQFLKTYPLSSTDKITITKNSVKYNDTDITSEVTGLDEFFSIGADISTITTSANIALGEITEDISYSVKSNKRAVYTGEDVIYSSQTFIKE